MSLRIKDPKTLPNGGFPYEEAGRRFLPMVSLAFQKSEVLTFRKDNNRPRATLQEVDEDLNNFICNRSPELCYDGNIRVEGSPYRAVRGCGSCGGKPA